MVLVWVLVIDKTEASGSRLQTHGWNDFSN